MAIQNFIGGGFKGKLGATIGQGWKNKKVIRTAFVPANPRTKKQQSNRSDFAKCVKMAQLAMQMDFRGIGFASEDNTEWALRISSARKYFSKTLPEMYCIPLIPYGTVAKYAVSDDFETRGNAIVFKIVSDDDLNSRKVAVLLYLKKTGTEEYEYFVIQSSVTGVTGNWEFSATIPAGFEVAENSLACAVSNDDVVLTSKIYRSPFSIFNPIIEVPFTITNQLVTPIATGDTKRTITFTPSVTLENASLDITGVSASGVLQGQSKNVTGKIVSASANAITVEIDTNVLDNLNQLVQFPTGSSVIVPAFSFTVGYNRYIYEGGTFSLSETTVQQTFYDWDSLELETSEYGGTYKLQGVSSVQSGSFGNVSYVNGVNVDTFILNMETSADGLVYTFRGNRNYWGATRNLPLQTAFVFTASGVTYIVNVGDTVPIVPYVTELLVDVANRVVSARCKHDDDGGWCTATIGQTPDGNAASLWGSHATPIVSTTSNGITREWGTRTPSNSGSILFLFGYDASYYPASGTCTFVFTESFEESTVLANTDGYKLTLKVTAGTQTGVYTYESD